MHDTGGVLRGPVHVALVAADLRNGIPRQTVRATVGFSPVPSS
ncbi:MAG TPA: hypothetical protein VJ482_08680 [Acidimicrobiia bacterium]|nr:hypothetical protein [Acidimicrobiia bacterium]